MQPAKPLRLQENSGWVMNFGKYLSITYSKHVGGIWTNPVSEIFP